MNFVTVREFRDSSGTIWKRLQKEKELVITSNGKPVAILSATSGSTLEDSLQALRAAKAAIAVAAIRAESVHRGTDKLSDREIKAEILRVRGKSHNLQSKKKR